ncbi:MAG: zf-HC2 domain-containing protein [Nanoarchaeota archaeon]|nr:zf-HC2 domain-containing protein [Nanoarchaeota archaeon]
MSNYCEIGEDIARLYPNIPDEIMEHITKCDECSEILRLVQSSDEIEKEDLYKKYPDLVRTPNCPNDNYLAAYADNSLGEKKREKIKEHLLICKHCSLIIFDFIKFRRIEHCEAE